MADRTGGVSMRWLFVGLFAIASCGTNPPSSTNPTSSTTSSNATWHPTEPSGVVKIHLDPKASLHDAQQKIIHDACLDAVLVWGDLRVEPGTRAVEISAGDAVLKGFLVCESNIEAFLKLQLANPRLKPGHGGSADLKWRNGQLFLHRRWSAGEVQLGRLSPPPDNVFQKDEALAAIFTCEDPKAPVADVFDALTRAPKVFLFGMYSLRD